MITMIFEVQINQHIIIQQGMIDYLGKQKISQMFLQTLMAAFQLEIRICIVLIRIFSKEYIYLSDHLKSRSAWSLLCKNNITPLSSEIRKVMFT